MYENNKSNVIGEAELTEAYNTINNYPNEEISENSDIILRHLIGDNGTLAWKPVVGRYINFKYNLLLSKLKQYKKKKYKTNEVKTDKTDILVSFTPCRSDYQDFIHPITTRLSKKDIAVSIILSRSRYDKEINMAKYHDPEFNFFNDYINKKVIKDAKREYTMHKQDLLNLSENLSLCFYEETKLCFFFQNYYIDKYVFLNVLKDHAPSVIYSIHFVGNPGYLSAIRSYKKSNEINVILIQHGVFDRSNFHDFNGADEVILWGKYFENVINDTTYSDTVETVTIGNPKLQNKKREFKTERRGTDLTNESTKKILFASTPVAYNNDAIDLFLESVENDWDLVFKPHPSISNNEFKQYFETRSINPSELINRESVYSLIGSADVVVGTVSTVLLESVALGTPSIQILLNEGQADWGRFIMSSSESTDLNEKLKHILDNKKHKEEVLQSQQKYMYQIFGDLDNATAKITDHIYYNYI